MNGRAVWNPRVHSVNALRFEDHNSSSQEV